MFRDAPQSCGSERREIEPGEVIIIGEDGTFDTPSCRAQRHRLRVRVCLFARPDSVIMAVRSMPYGTVKACERACREASLVTGMPDSGTIALRLRGRERRTLRAALSATGTWTDLHEPTSRVRHLGVRTESHHRVPMEERRRRRRLDGTTCERMISMIKSCATRSIHPCSGALPSQRDRQFTRWNRQPRA